MMVNAYYKLIADFSRRNQREKQSEEQKMAKTK
jgi:plasmid segregation protein ParM